LADDLIYIHSTGVVQKKEEYLKALRCGDLIYEQITTFHARHCSIGCGKGAELYCAVSVHAEKHMGRNGCDLCPARVITPDDDRASVNLGMSPLSNASTRECKGDY